MSVRIRQGVPNSEKKMNTEKPKAYLKDWCVGTTCESHDPLYAAPEQWRTSIGGKVFGSTKFNDGDDIVIGAPIRFDPVTREVETKNTIYVLQEIDAEYVKAYEDPLSTKSVEQRVFDALITAIKTN